MDVRKNCQVSADHALPSQIMKLLNATKTGDGESADDDSKDEPKAVRRPRRPTAIGLALGFFLPAPGTGNDLRL